MIDLAAFLASDRQMRGRVIFTHGFGDDRDDFIAHTWYGRQFDHATAGIIVVGDVVYFVNIV